MNKNINSVTSYKKVTIILPIKNGSHALDKTIGSLIKEKQYIKEIIFVDDASTDNSSELINSILKNKKVNFSIIKNNKSRGLSYTYNLGLKKAKTRYVVTMHQDIILLRNSLKKLILPIQTNQKQTVVATYHSVIHPMQIWKKYNFWGQALFAKLLDKKFSGLDGKFDCFDIYYLKKVGLFDQEHFETSGEDGDIWHKLKKHGSILLSDAVIIHNHGANNQINAFDYLYKHAQQAQSQGVLLRLHGADQITHFFKSFHREILFIGSLLPIIRMFFIPIVIFYIFYYSWPIYVRYHLNTQTILLTIINLLILPTSFIFSFHGYITSEQTL